MIQKNKKENKKEHEKVEKKQRTNLMIAHFKTLIKAHKT